jgi:hypothetical protein
MTVTNDFTLGSALRFGLESGLDRRIFEVARTV